MSSVESFLAIPFKMKVMVVGFSKTGSSSTPSL